MNKENDFLLKQIARIPYHLKTCFIAGVVIGVITHIYMLTNKLPNWDDINNLSGFGSGADLGRWFLEVVRPLSGRWSVPALNGMLAIIILALAACFLVAALNLNSVITSILVPLILFTFPGLASTMTFMFTVNSYMLGILIGCITAFLTCRYKKGFIPAIILLTLSMGIYQSYVCLVAGILLLSLIIKAFNAMKMKDLMIEGVKSLITLVVGMLLYIILSKIFYPNLADYQGVNNMGQIEIMRLPRLIMRSYKRILEFFVLDPLSFVTKAMQVTNIGVCIMIVVLLVLIIVNKRLFHDKVRVFFIIVMTGLIPLALAATYIMAPDIGDPSLLMLYQYSFVYIIVIALIEIYYASIQGKEKIGAAERIKKIVFFLAVALIIGVGYQNYVVTNEAYFRVGIAFERVSAYYNRIIMKVEEQNGYKYGDSIEIIGEFYPDPNPLSGYAIDGERFVDFSGIALESGMLTSGVRRNFIRTYLGLDFPELSADLVKEIQKGNKFKMMPVYPEEGAIQLIDGIWVVKVHE